MAKKLSVNSDTTNLKKLREEYTTLDTPPKKSKPSLNELLLEVDVAVAVTELTEYAFAMKNFAAVRGIS